MKKDTLNDLLIGTAALGCLIHIINKFGGIKMFEKQEELTRDIINAMMDNLLDRMDHLRSEGLSDMSEASLLKGSVQRLEKENLDLKAEVGKLKKKLAKVRARKRRVVKPTRAIRRRKPKKARLKAIKRKPMKTKAIPRAKAKKEKVVTPAKRKGNYSKNSERMKAVQARARELRGQGVGAWNALKMASNEYKEKLLL